MDEMPNAPIGGTKDALMFAGTRGVWMGRKSMGHGVWRGVLVAGIKFSEPGADQKSLEVLTV